MTETYSSDGPICPHCSFQFTADEPHYFDENGYTEDTCPTCEKPFRIFVHTSVSWCCGSVEDEQ